MVQILPNRLASLYMELGISLVQAAFNYIWKLYGCTRIIKFALNLTRFHLNIILYAHVGVCEQRTTPSAETVTTRIRKRGRLHNNAVIVLAVFMT